MRIKYIKQTQPFMLTKGKIYTVLAIEKGWYRLVDDTGEDYLYPPESFEVIDPEESHIVYVISGPPASGKTTYVESHKQQGDLVIDFDKICAALGGTDEMYEDHKPYLDVALAVRDAAYEKIRKREGNWKNAYVITALKDQNKVAALVKDLGAELIRIEVTKETCIKNVQNDPRRKLSVEKFIKLINEYFE